MKSKSLAERKATILFK